MITLGISGNQIVIFTDEAVECAGHMKLGMSDEAALALHAQLGHLLQTRQVAVHTIPAPGLMPRHAGGNFVAATRQPVGMRQRAAPRLLPASRQRR